MLTCHTKFFNQIFLNPTKIRQEIKPLILNFQQNQILHHQVIPYKHNNQCIIEVTHQKQWRKKSHHQITYKNTKLADIIWKNIYHKNNKHSRIISKDNESIQHRWTTSNKTQIIFTAMDPEYSVEQYLNAVTANSILNEGPEPINTPFIENGFTNVQH